MSVNGVVDDHLLAVVLVLRISDIKTSQTLHDGNNTFCLQERIQKCLNLVGHAESPCIGTFMDSNL